MVTEKDYKRLCWASRRGMLELDLILVPFVKSRFRQLPLRDQERYVKLLECEDTELFGWFLGRQLPEEEALRTIVLQIIDYSKNRQPD